MDRNASERVYAGGKDTEGVEDGPDSADMEEESVRKQLGTKNSKSTEDR